MENSPYILEMSVAERVSGPQPAPSIEKHGIFASLMDSANFNAMFLEWAPLRGRAFLRFLGWGGVGCDNVHISCVQGDATWMLR